jgi:hypothetical protein
VLIPRGLLCMRDSEFKAMGNAEVSTYFAPCRMWQRVHWLVTVVGSYAFLIVRGGSCNNQVSQLHPLGILTNSRLRSENPLQYLEFRSPLRPCTFRDESACLRVRASRKESGLILTHRNSCRPRGRIRWRSARICLFLPPVLLVLGG